MLLSRKYILLVVVFSTLSGIFSMHAQSDAKSRMFVANQISQQKVYVGECVLLKRLLYSESPDVVDLRQITDNVDENSQFETFMRVVDYNNAYIEEVNGAKMYVFPVSTYAAVANKPGAYQYGNTNYQVAVNVPKVIDDPFWGHMRVATTEWSNIESIPVKFDVTELPIPNDSDSFSGAVGNFKIDVEVPDGRIIINESATVVIKLSGEGIIPQNVIPDYQEAFKNGVRLRSMAEKDNLSYNDGKVISVKFLECEFLPITRENCEIGEVSFCFFNPATGKYETVKSKPIKIDVKSSTVKREIKDA